MLEQKEQPGEKKIIIDEDWKSQVQKEKEQANAGKQEAPGEPAELPPVSLSLLCATLATQAFVGLGLVPHPATQNRGIDLGTAKHFIDMLGVLEEKTKGNLTPDEKKHLDGLLFELRMQYVEVSSKKA